MKLAMRMADKSALKAENDRDPREGESAEIIDLASRTAYPQVTQRKGRSDAMGMVSGVAIVAVLGLATLWGMDSARYDAKQPAQQAPAVQPAPQAAVPLPEQAPALPMAAPAPVPQADPAPAPVYSGQPQPAPGLAMNPYSSPTVVYDSSAMPAPVAPGTAVDQAAGAAASGNSAADFASRIGGVGGGPTQAKADIDPQTTVAQGTLIPAVLETAINTDVPGFVRAVVSQDVRSFDGTRVLLPRSSRLIGQYQSGLQAGQKRAYVIWTRAIRPDGVSVSLASPGTAFDGSGGIPGKVDSHFFQKFGSAMLLSVVGGLSAIGSSGAGVVLGGGQSAAAAAVQGNQNISPTIRVRPGEPIRVVTARDLDFSRAPRL